MTWPAVRRSCPSSWGPTLRSAEVLDDAFAPWPILASRIRDERGEIRRHVNVFVDGEDAKRLDGVATSVTPRSTVHVINAVSGG